MESEKDRNEANQVPKTWDSEFPLMGACPSLSFAFGLITAMSDALISRTLGTRSYRYLPQYDDTAILIGIMMIAWEWQSALPAVFMTWRHSGRIKNCGTFSLISELFVFLLRCIAVYCCGYYVGSLLWPIDAEYARVPAHFTVTLELLASMFLVHLYLVFTIYSGCFDHDTDLLAVRAGLSSNKVNTIPLGSGAGDFSILRRYRLRQGCYLVTCLIPAVPATMFACQRSDICEMGLRPISPADPLLYCLVLIAVINFSNQWRESFCRLWVFAKIMGGMLWRTVFFTRVCTNISCGIAFHQVLVAVYRLEEVDIYGFNASTQIWFTLVTAVLNLFCAYEARSLERLISQAREQSEDKSV